MNAEDDDSLVPENDAQWERTVRGLVDGSESAYTDFWNRYGQRLNRIASRHLPDGLQRRIAPEDLVQSVCRTFYRRASGGEFELTDSEGLWRLLCAITLNKVRMKIRFHMRQRRAPNRELHLDQADASRGRRSDEQADGGIQPDEAAVFAEQLQQVMEVLNEEECAVIQAKLENCSSREIAERVGCSERTVRRIFHRVRGRLKETLLDSLSE